MKPDILQFNFFNTEISTDDVPFFYTYSAKYKAGTADNCLAKYMDGTADINFHEVFKEVSRDTNILEISEKIDNEGINLIVDSICFNKSLTIKLRVNNFMSYISVNLNGSGFGGAIMIDDCIGFYYTLIMSEDTVRGENERLMVDRKLRKQNKRKLP